MRRVETESLPLGPVAAGRARSARGSAAALLGALRPKQWTKNLLLLAAPGAGGVLFHPRILARSALAVAAFTMIASAGYLLNDILDLESDRRHPVRRERGIAAGAVSTRAAAVSGVLLVSAGAVLSALLGWPFLAAVGVYVALVGAYSVRLKRVAVIDIAVVSFFYVIRAVAGSAATGVTLSQWFLILISFAALFAVAGKRYAEYTLLGADATAARTPLQGYTAGYLRYVWMVASAVAIAAYCLWSFAQPHVTHRVPWSEFSAIPFVLAILRYALLLETGRGGAPEDVILGDRMLQVLGAVWLLVYGSGVYLGR